ncbi:MAG: FAD-dependent monooxygenase [Rhodospirillales bacterium]
MAKRAKPAKIKTAPKVAPRAAPKSAAAPRYDAAVIGAGLVGRAAALALNLKGFRVALIDRAPPETGLDEDFDGRASAVALASHRLLRAAGAWDGLAAHAAPIRGIRVSEGASRLHLHFDSRELGEDPFGFQVENRHLRTALYKAVRAAAGIDWLAPAAPERLDAAAGEILLADGRTVRARLIIGADGRSSWTRTQLGIPVTSWAYGQTAIVCAVRHERAHDFIAHEHFLPAGPFAILPLPGAAPGTGDDPGKESSIVWSEDAELAQHIMTLDDAAFAGELRRRFGDFLGHVTPGAKRWAYPLSLQTARDSVGPRTVLIGDADHAMHPIAGQGLNVGLRDVAALADALADAAGLGLDIGAADVLRRWRRRRRFDNTRMLTATDGLTWLFSNRVRPLRGLRGLGLAAVGRIGPARRYFMRSAMGVKGAAPSLMQ